MKTNINILGQGNVFNYAIEYHTTNSIVENTIYTKDIDENREYISLWLDTPGYIKYQNYWKQTQSEFTNEYVPNKCKCSYLTLYFPDHAVDSYNIYTQYILTATIYIHGRSVILVSKIINRNDALACEREKVIFNQSYYEKYDIDILDPQEILYSDDWKEFRVNICGEMEFGNYQLNNTESTIYISLHPVIQNNDGVYIKMDHFIGGQNNIRFWDTNNHFKLLIESNIDKYLGDQQPSINCSLYFNKNYNNNLKEYLLETYQKENCSIQYSLVIGNENDLYLNIQSPLLTLDEISYNFDKKHILETNNFLNWNGWEEGLHIICSINVLDEDQQSVLYLLSNKIPLTQELFKYFVKSSDFEIKNSIINSVNLDSVDMKLYNIKTVNKIVNQVIQVDKPETTKNNLIQPVFFRVSEISDIIIHCEVTENICLNLDQYKSQVNRFILNIEGIDFPEIGRTSAGVLFKIKGKSLPCNNRSGSYYILNQDSELVTIGKYKYEI